jgi:hypothetical protein
VWLVLQKVAERKQGKNRMHRDIPSRDLDADWATCLRLAWIPMEPLPANRSRGIRPFLGVHSRMGISEWLYLITVQPPPVRAASVRTGRSPVARGRYRSALSTSSYRRGLYAEKPHDIVAERLPVHVRS